MSLEKELKLAAPLNNINHETLLSIFRTYSMLMRFSDRFFSKYGVTDIQFNILMTLKDYPRNGLTQNELSEKLIVSKSNTVGLIDRLEKIGMVKREAHAKDRRINQIFLTQKGKKLIDEVYTPYFEEVDKLINPLSTQEKKSVISAMEKIRGYVRSKGA